MPANRTRILAALFLIALLSIASYAQTTQTGARPDRGINNGGSYSVSDIESISLNNGNINLSIPLASLPPIAGGKLSFSLSANYNSKVWDVARYQHEYGNLSNTMYVVDVPQPAPMGGWTFGARYALFLREAHDDFFYLMPQQNQVTSDEWVQMQYTYYKCVFVLPDGSEHELRPYDGAIPYTGTNSFLRGYFRTTPDTTGVPMRYFSFDGSHIFAIVNPSSNPIRATVYMPDGTQVIQYSNGIERITDTNGNSIKIFEDTNGTHYQDEGTGREIKLTLDQSANNGHGRYQAWYQTVGGTWEHVDINMGTTSVQGVVYDIQDWNPYGGETGGGTECTHQDYIQTNLWVIRSIVYPATQPGFSPQYTFNYDSDTSTQATSEVKFGTCQDQMQSYTRNVSDGIGELSQVMMPSGATVSYTYSGFGPTIEPAFFTDANDMARRVVATKTIDHDGASDIWRYTFAYLGGNTQVEAPDGSSTSEDFYPHDHAYSHYFGMTGKSGLSYRTTRPGIVVERHWSLMTFQGAENMMASGSISDLVPFNVVVDAEYTTLVGTGSSPSKMSAKTYQYDYNGNLLQETDYDWFDPSSVTRDAQNIPTGVPAGATVLRTINSNYYNQATSASSSNVYAKRSTSALPLILNAPQETIVGDSDTQFSYDGQGYGIAPTVGNVTQVSRLDNKGTSGTNDDTWLNTVNTYGTYGNLSTTTDPKGNVTQLFYDDSTHALPTRVVVDPLNSTGQQTTTTAYDCYTGLVTSQTDANGNTSTIDYTNQLLGTVDPFGRPGIATGPAVTINGTTRHRKVKTSYYDSTRQVEVAADLNSEGDGLLKSRVTSDQLGRTVLTEQSEDGSNFTSNTTISVQTVYEQMGKITYRSNPKRSASTDGWTRMTRDVLGRVIEVANFSGASQPPSSGTNANWDGSVSTAYDSNVTTVTDQAGKVRRSVTDALGRLVRVDEPDLNGNLGAASNPTQPTSYTYDVLGNLRMVAQGSQQRFFMYDSLSRLIRAKNPEQAANPSLALTDPVSGNSQWSMKYDYDADGNLTSRIDALGVTTMYAYDGLNRNITVDYSDTTTINPDITRKYDGAIQGKGRFWYEFAGGDYNNGSTVSHRAIDSYDAMGRPLVQRQLFKTASGWGSTYQVQRTYDLAGHTLSETYPSGHTVSYSYDGAGRTNSFTGTLGDGVNRTYSTGIKYNSWNSMTQEQFGTTTPIYNKLFYNVRGQLSQIRESTTHDDDYWNRGAIINHYSDQSWAGSGTDNNGNLKRQDVYIPGDDNISSYTRSTFWYDYDSLNRLSSAREDRDGTWQWGQYYSYDRWGNRTIDATQTWGNGIPKPQFTVDTTTNRLGVPSGQSGVMSYDANGNLYNDTYTGTGSRTYDEENRMVTAQDINGQTARYTYDANGNRARRSILNQETWQIYGMDGELLSEYAANASPSSPQKEYGYRNGQLLVTASPTSSSSRTNVALSSNGSTATASSTYAGYSFPASNAINGEHKGLNYYNGGTWHSGSPTFPQWLQVDFNGTKLIDEIDLYTVQDNYTNPSEPTEQMTFSMYGLTGYEVQYWNGSAWVTVTGGSVTGNNLVWRKFTFTPITTSKIRVVTNASVDGWSRIVEVEAYGTDAPQRSNVASASNGSTASASSTYPSYSFPASAAINGEHKGLDYYNGGTWHSGASSFPQWLQVDFPGSKTIGEIDVFTVQDNYSNPSEPTESMTFSLYGLTSFDVQYWNGTAWVTIPSGSVSGNNLVWRKFTFSPITTTKIRVVTNASVDGWSRIVEVEAYQSLQNSADIRWMVADQLGTPRMIVDQSGSLSGISRHDYLPFGEELYAGVGGRSSQLGYTGNDSLRQKFTQKERDVETGLDYFGARYYSSAQGRFTSPDEPFADQEENGPQSWNLYAYTSNNPLNRVDADGRRWFTKRGELPVWVNPNEDGTYTSPGEGWEPFISTPEHPYLLIYSEDGNRVLVLGENQDGSPYIRGPLWTGRVEERPGDIIAAVDIVRSVLEIGRAAIASWAARTAENAADDAIETVSQQVARASGTRAPSSAAGRSVQSLRESIASGNGIWRRVSAHAERAAGRAYKGATSIEEVFVNKQTGERIVRHTIVRGNSVLHETFRLYAKHGR